MKERKQKIPVSTGSRPQKDSPECESYEGVQTFMVITENNLKEVQFERGNLLEFILSPGNLNRAYMQVKRNHGSCGVDGLSTEQLGDYLKEHKDESPWYPDGGGQGNPTGHQPNTESYL